MTTKHQISSHSDMLLNKLSRKLTKAEKTLKEAEKEKVDTWQEIDDILAEHGFSDREARFIAEDGHTIHRQIRPGSPKLDLEALHEALIARYGQIKAARLWKEITLPAVDSELLEIAVQQGRIDGAIVDSCITGRPVPYHYHPAWTRKDKERAEIFGVKLEVE